jgi:hypothetical protein
LREFEPGLYELLGYASPPECYWDERVVEVKRAALLPVRQEGFLALRGKDKPARSLIVLDAGDVGHDRAL